jgi:CTP-dependent riboflavin kinase
MTVREKFLIKLYELSKQELILIDRYEVGKELKLSKEETDAVVDELDDRGRIKKIVGTKIVLGFNEKKILDSEWRRVE